MGEATHAASDTGGVPLTIVLDVEDVDATALFWCEKLGFRVVGFDRDAPPFGACTIAGPGNAPVHFLLRSLGPRPALGCSPGSMRRMVIVVPDLDETIALLGDGISWVDPPAGDGQEPKASVILDDPNGYRLELRSGRPAGSSCDVASP